MLAVQRAPEGGPGRFQECLHIREHGWNVGEFASSPSSYFSCGNTPVSDSGSSSRGETESLGIADESWCIAAIFLDTSQPR